MSDGNVKLTDYDKQIREVEAGWSKYQDPNKPHSRYEVNTHDTRHHAQREGISGWVSNLSLSSATWIGKAGRKRAKVEGRACEVE